MGKKLYVGNLPDSAIEQDLADKFAAYGTVKSVKLITERFSGRGKVFCFIEMMSEVEAHAAIDSLNGTDYEGRLKWQPKAAGRHLIFSPLSSRRHL